MLVWIHGKNVKGSQVKSIVDPAMNPLNFIND